MFLMKKGYKLTTESFSETIHSATTTVALSQSPKTIFSYFGPVKRRIFHVRMLKIENDRHIVQTKDNNVANSCYFVFRFGLKRLKRPRKYV